MIKQAIIFFFISVFLGLSQTAGVGGGPIVNILLMISMDYNTKLSISITYIFLIGGSIASIWKNIQKINPKTNRSYLNIQIILLTIPTMSSGALFGGIIKNFLSELIITILFVCLFVYLIYDLRKMLVKIRTDNNKQLIRIKSPQQYQQKIDVSNIVINNSTLSLAPVPNPHLSSGKTDSKPGYGQLVKLSVSYYIFTVVVSLLRGGARYQSIIHINPCGFYGWVILLIHISVSIYVSYRTANYIINGNDNLDKNQQNKALIQSSGHFNHQDSNSQVNKDNVVYFQLAGFMAGLIGATLAIGGALILIPAWLKLGIDKQIIVSSTPTLILISAMVAFTIAYFNNQYESVSSILLIFYLILAFVSAAVVKDIITYVTNKYKLKSLIIVLLLVVVFLSMMILVPFQAVKLFGDYDKFISFGILC